MSMSSDEIKIHIKYKNTYSPRGFRIAVALMWRTARTCLMSDTYRANIFVRQIEEFLVVGAFCVF